PVTARQAGDDTLIPLPGGADPNVPIEVGLRLGKPAESKGQATLELPTVFAPVLKTQWNLQADENHVLVPDGGSIASSIPEVWPNGFEWLAGRGLVHLITIACLTFVVISVRSLPISVTAYAIIMVVAGGAGWYAFEQIQPAAPLQISVPVLASGETVSLQVNNLPTWRAYVAWPGVALGLVGLGLLALGLLRFAYSRLLRWLALGLIAAGLLMQYNSAPVFLALVALTILLFQFVPSVILWSKSLHHSTESGIDTQGPPPAEAGTGSIATTPILIFLMGTGLLGTTNPLQAADETSLAVKTVQTSATALESIQSASSLIQTWTVSSREKRLTASADMVISGRPGDRYVLLRAPAVLTQFKGDGLRLSKIELAGQGVTYVVSIPATTSDAPGTSKDTVTPKDTATAEGKDKPEGADKPADDAQPVKQYTATFQFQLEAIQPAAGIPVLTGGAALQQIDLSYDEANWEVICDSAARIEPMATEPATPDQARVKILLGPGQAKVVLRPQTRDLTTEKTQFFVEGAELYTPAPGVIDGTHRFKIRTSQGRVQSLGILIPTGLTVSAVDGPVSSWQFDADKSRLQLQIDPTVQAEFTITVQTQRSLDALPTVAEVSPLRVEGADGSVGLIALAFGSEAQPENVQSASLSLVNLGDLDTSLLTNPQTTLHRVYRYGAEGGSLSVQVSPVAPEVRVVSNQVISFGDERIVLGINLIAEITRTGLFQLSFPLPTGLEVESLTGDALHHWSELTENNQRQIVLHLKGKTLGTQKFALSLAGTTPSDATEWAIPRFELNESTRQTGELVVQPTTGIRLRTVTRQNISEADPRTLGATGQGALAFRLLQRDWSLQLGIEKLAPWVTGQVLHDVTLREGQTRSTLLADFTVQNAAIRSMLIKLPTMGADELKTVRASGDTVSDFIRSAQDESVWELRFKRRVIGPVQFQIEYERRGERPGDSETLNQVDFPDARQVGYYFAVRAGGRLEIEPGTLTQGWQRNDWSTVPQALRELGNRNAPALALRAMAPPTPLSLRVIRHSLADALKLRVASGTLTTILSPTGDQLTSVDVNMEVIQRSNLTVQLPVAGELFSIFVNGESVHSVRHQANNTWQFTIVPGLDDRSAQVRFVYSLKGASLQKLNLVSPQLNVPLEKIQWNVIAPSGFELIDSDGNLELVSQTSGAKYDRQAYLSSLQGTRQNQAQEAAKLLEQANELLQTGEQSKAQWAFGNVANRYALDAASNEDARVQLENLQRQQAVVGLNTRRQRLFLDSSRGDDTMADNQQMRQAAAVNPILQQEQLNYRPQELSQLLAGNSQEDNANLQQIAGRLVQHQRTTEPAPQAIVISLPEDGNVYSFRRSVQVAENAPLELQLQFQSKYKLQTWQWGLVAGLIGLVAAGLAFTRTNPPAA
ncbi:MAG: hypothetical protein IT423_12370, partial [Pirellulaceae bacterium]|nr:hypothetical protein [Pirellulaceae bacterium]